MSKILVINTDGGARGNPGPAGIGVVIKDAASGEIIFEHGGYVGETTNNIAEYKALLKAVETSRDLGASEVKINMDSELIVRQMLGQYKIKQPDLQKLAAEVIKVLKSFSKYSFTHVRREFNKEADALVNQALDAHLGVAPKIY
jgi:ribonuclease HI